MNKHYISPQQLLQDSYQLGWQVYASGFRPNFLLGVWRGGTPVAIAIHELLHILGVSCDHTAIRTSSYSGMRRNEAAVQVDGLEYLSDKLSDGDRLLLVDDVHDTGLSLQQAVHELREAHGDLCPEIRLATPYYKPGNKRSATKPDYFVHQTEDWLVFPHELDGLSLEEMRANKPELAPVMAAISEALAPG